MKIQREPTTPGEILSEEFLKPLAMSQTDLADHIGCDVKVVNRIVNGRSSVTAEMAIRLGAASQDEPRVLAQRPATRRHLPRRSDNEEGPGAHSPCGLNPLVLHCGFEVPVDWRAKPLGIRIRAPGELRTAPVADLAVGGNRG